jgi:replication fork protection complex subunit Csm3/Swi3
MLNMYQLWLDDLYPRAKFADALAIIEKVGHTKRMQIMRKDWIDEGKPRRTTEQDKDVEEAEAEKTPVQQSTEEMEGVEKNGGLSDPRPTEERQESTHSRPDDTAAPTAGEDPDDDELDALLAESEHPSATTSKTLPSRAAPTENDPFEDEMEAMADMDDTWD